MAHFALVDKNKIVLQIIVVDNKDCLDENGNESEAAGVEFIKQLYSGMPKNSIYNNSENFWVRTSYNETIRKNYAGIGHKYDENKDAFIAPMPTEKKLDENLAEVSGAYVLNETTCKWEFIEAPKVGK